ncbi:GlxA family transcriptional regulator [Svornostia abyssi]|uniref:GlxA family transcriptional regulator n=1 Tax=Svornostia abyssi TaxID=2898438 RepID=A0ABY5PI86_9ACTN|nr:GlxA family transcriptional regulator [Parviterribacteraceae bacterium J379]
MAARRVVVVTPDQVQPLDAIGPVEVFHTASLVRGRTPAYAIEVVTPGGGVVTTRSGLRLLADPLPQDTTTIDTLLIAGGEGTRAAARDDDLLAWVRTVAATARRTTSVCTGSFVLAATGLLDGRRATTHWMWCDLLQRSFPAVAVEPDPIYVRDGKLWTSAGVTAGMDLALALVEDDLGPEIALEVARRLVVFVKRPGGQAQFSAGLAAQAARRDPLRELQAWLVDHLDEDLSVAALAQRACLSERQFTRVFKAETGMTPATYVEALRVERARLLLHDGATVDEAARATGFRSAEVLRRAFHRRIGVAPSAYRERFHRAA